jgi:hypothetical protein
MMPITSVTLTIAGNAQEFRRGTDPGIAQIRYALAPVQGVPEGGVTIWLTLAAVGGLFAVHRVRQGRQFSVNK